MCASMSTRIFIDGVAIAAKKVVLEVVAAGEIDAYIHTNIYGLYMHLHMHIPRHTCTRADIHNTYKCAGIQSTYIRAHVLFFYSFI